jgi:hypothetical protein
LREKPVLIARQTVVKSLKDNPEMALKYLERKRKKEFSTRTETDITGDLSMNIKVMSDDELLSLVRK